MSKYTTEVRYICESVSGLTESVGFNEVDNIISKSWDKIFDSSIPVFDENYREILFSKILRHYYTREIGFETVGLWKLKINTKLKEIMPYYNKLYESELIEFNVLEDIHIKKDYTKTTDSTINVDGENSNNGTVNNQSSVDENISGNNTVIDNVSHLDAYSDTPQGAVGNLENYTYLTNARKITDNNNSNTTNENTRTGSTSNLTTNQTNGTNKSTTVTDNIDTYIETVTGRSGRLCSSEIIMKFRESLLNIDMMIIDELYNMFMLIW